MVSSLSLSPQTALLSHPKSILLHMIILEYASYSTILKRNPIITSNALNIKNLTTKIG